MHLEFDKWFKELDALVWEETGDRADDFEEEEVRDYYDRGYTPAETFATLLAGGENY